MPSACAQAGTRAIRQVAYRHNSVRVSMMPFSSIKMYVESMCYHCRAYAPRTQVVRDRIFIGATETLRSVMPTQPLACLLPLWLCGEPCGLAARRLSPIGRRG